MEDSARVFQSSIKSIWEGIDNLQTRIDDLRNKLASEDIYAYVDVLQEGRGQNFEDMSEQIELPGITSDDRSFFCDGLSNLQQNIRKTMHEKGFEPSDTPRALALIHSEVSEALEADRKAEDHFHEFAEELADIVIRVLDLAQYRSINIALEIRDKMEKNRAGPERHNSGKKY